MIRKIISIFLALLLCMSLAVSASAEEQAIDFIIDEFDYLVAEELNDLNALALRIYEETGVGIFFVYTREESLKDYDVGSLTGGMENYFVMMENDESWYTVKGGLGEDIDVAAEDVLRAVYDATDTYVSGVEDFLYAAAAYFPYIADTSEGDILEAEELLLFDEADLLTDSEEAALTQKLMDVSHSYNAQIVVATMASMDGGNIDFFVDYLYDSMGFGYGENHDGVLLLVCMDPREYRILSNGYAGVAINPDTIGKISDEIVVNLSGGDYAGAFDEFADECAYYLEGYLNGFPFKTGKNLIIALVIGIVLALIVTSALKAQLKSVRKQNQANSSVRDGSMQLTLSNDIFLYRNVTRTKKQSNNSSGSRSGGSRSVGGGSF